MSTGTRSKRSAVQEAGTPAKMAKISNHVGEVDGKPFSTPAPPSKAKGKGSKIHSGQHCMMLLAALTDSHNYIKVCMVGASVQAGGQTPSVP